jgi:thiamine-phosphate pyrophosphorylase
MAVRPHVMMVTDRHRLEKGGGSDIDALVRAAARAARGGATMIQVRERGLDDGVLLDLTEKIVKQAAAAGVKVVVNDRVDVALASGADGVHLPAHGARPERVRPIVPPGFLIGRSVHAESEAVEIAGSGACDYLIFGSVFPTAGKPAGHAPAGADALGRVCRAVALPVIAIGGIVPDRAGEVARAGAAGIAAIGLFAGGPGEPGELGNDEHRLRAAVQQIEDAFTG